MFLDKVSLNHHISMKEENKNKSLTYSKHFNKKVTAFKMNCSCKKKFKSKTVSCCMGLVLATYPASLIMMVM